MDVIPVLKDAPSLDSFIEEVAGREDPDNRHVVPRCDLKLENDGHLAVQGTVLNRKFPVSPDGLRDLAHLAVIPVSYFDDCDTELRALSFNRRLGQKVASELPLQIIVKNGAVARVQDSNLLPAPRLPMLHSILHSIPDNLIKSDIKVVKHHWNGSFDISVIHPGIICEPRRGDVIAFGINVSEDPDGSIQVQGAAFRLVCSNGAINRTCDGRHHRLRRPVNRPDHQDTFLRRFESFAAEAWRRWPRSAEGLSRLDEVVLGLEQHDALMSRLRQAPFFLSLRVVERIVGRLPHEMAGRGGPPTLYDLYNAMTFLGTHDSTLSPTYRARLRLGAGEFTRHESSVCTSCRQLVVRHGKRPITEHPAGPEET